MATILPSTTTDSRCHSPSTSPGNGNGRTKDQACRKSVKPEIRKCRPSHPLAHISARQEVIGEREPSSPFFLSQTALPLPSFLLMFRKSCRNSRLQPHRLPGEEYLRWSSPRKMSAGLKVTRLVHTRPETDSPRPNDAAHGYKTLRCTR